MSKILFKTESGSVRHYWQICTKQYAFKFRSLSITLLLSVGSITWTQVRAENLTLQQAISRVQNYQQSQGLWKTQQDITATNIKQTQLWKNPSLSVDQKGLRSGQDKELTIGISQELDVFGQRRANQQLAQIAQTQSVLNQRIYQAQIDLIVKYFWSQLAILELERDVVMEQLKVSQENLAAIEKRYRAGSIAQVEVDRVRMSHAENLRLYQQADLQLQITTQQLSSLWGEADKTINIGLSAQYLWPDSTAKQVQQYLQENLVEQARQLNVLESKASVEVLKAQARPNPSVSLGVSNNRSPESGTDNQISIGVSIPLNIFDRNQYGVQIAQLKQQQLERQKDFYSKQNVLQINTLLTELQGLQLQFQQVDQSQIPLAVQVQQKTLQGFSAGKFALTDVQQATLQLQDVRLRKVQLLKEAWQRAVEAQSLSLGIDPSEVMSKDAITKINQSIWKDTQALPVIGGER